MAEHFSLACMATHSTTCECATFADTINALPGLSLFTLQSFFRKKNTISSYKYNK